MRNTNDFLAAAKERGYSQSYSYKMRTVLNNLLSIKPIEEWKDTEICKEAENMGYITVTMALRTAKMYKRFLADGTVTIDTGRTRYTAYRPPCYRETCIYNNEYCCRYRENELIEKIDQGKCQYFEKTKDQKVIKKFKRRPNHVAYRDSHCLQWR